MTYEKRATELPLRVSELLNSSNFGFKYQMQVVKVKVTVPNCKEVDIGFHNIANLFSNRFLSEYGGIKILTSETEAVYYFCIRNELTELLDLRKTLINGSRFTFESASIVSIGGNESTAINDLDSFLSVQNDILRTLDTRHRATGKNSHWFLYSKLPPIGLKRAAECS